MKRKPKTRKRARKAKPRKAVIRAPRPFHTPLPDYPSPIEDRARRIGIAAVAQAIGVAV